MDTKKLAALAAAVRLGSFTRAAEELGYTQSGLTHMMNSLEKDVGFPLLVRGRTGVRLTPAGQRIFPLVQECLNGAKALGREILLHRFRRAQPVVGVDILMGSVQEVYRWVQEGRVDMCFASRQESVALDWTPLKDDELFAILPPDYDNGGRSVFPVEDFDGREFLMTSMGYNLDIMRVLNSHGVKQMLRTTLVSDSDIISMVEHGLGVSMLSRLVLQGRQDDVQALPLAPRAVRELGIASRPRRDLRPMVRRFIAEAEEMIEKM